MITCTGGKNWGGRKLEAPDQPRTVPDGNRVTWSVAQPNLL